MLPINDQEPLGIALLGVSRKDQAMMELFLHKNWSSNCLVVPERQASLCILDLDGIEGKKLLQQQRDHHSQRPLIVLSVHETDIDGARVLRKPLQIELLKKEINRYRNELLEHAVKTMVGHSEHSPASKTSLRQRWEAPPIVPSQSDEPNNRRSGLPNAATQARVVYSSCGFARTAHQDKGADSDEIYFDEAILFLKILKGAIEQCRRESTPIKLHFTDGKYVTLLPKANIGMTNLSDTKLRPRCLLDVQTSQITIEASYYSETHLMRTSDGVPQSIDALLWKVALWSSRGRLPMGTDAELAVGLQQWPNLTRLLAIPEFLRIAALWIKNPLPLADTTQTLNIEHRYVYTFFSACQALDLIKVEVATENQTHGRPKSDDAQSGLLRRILRRLRIV
jgi:hypothetical protein